MIMILTGKCAIINNMSVCTNIIYVLKTLQILTKNIPILLLVMKKNSIQHHKFYVQNYI